MAAFQQCFNLKCARSSRVPVTRPASPADWKASAARAGVADPALTFAGQEKVEGRLAAALSFLERLNDVQRGFFAVGKEHQAIVAGEKGIGDAGETGA